MAVKDALKTTTPQWESAEAEQKRLLKELTQWEEAVNKWETDTSMQGKVGAVRLYSSKQDELQQLMRDRNARAELQTELKWKRNNKTVKGVFVGGDLVLVKCVAVIHIPELDHVFAVQGRGTATRITGAIHSANRVARMVRCLSCVQLKKRDAQPHSSQRLYPADERIGMSTSLRARVPFS